MAETESVIDSVWIDVSSCKFDGSIHRRWKARLVEKNEARIVLDGEFEVEVRHPVLGTIERGAKTREVFFLDRWYSVFQFLRPDGSTRLEYVNINLPPTMNGSALSFIDLDLDLLLRPDGTYSILDEDEFQTNAELFNYPSEIRSGVHRTVTELVERIKARRFPDFQLRKLNF